MVCASSVKDTHTKNVWRSSAHRTLLVNSSNSQNILATPATCRETCSVELCRSTRPTRFAHSSRWHCVVLPSDASPAPVPSVALWTSLPSAWLTASFAPLPAQQPSSRAQPQVWPTAVAVETLTLRTHPDQTCFKQPNTWPGSHSLQSLRHHHTPRVLNADQRSQRHRGSATEHVMIPCLLAFFHTFVCCGASGDIELAVAVCYLVNLICPSLGECSAYNVPTTHGSEHTCPSKGSSTSPFVDCLCQNINQSSVLRKAKNGSEIDAQRHASCTRNAARLRHLYASDLALSVSRAPVDTQWLRTGLGAPTPQCRLLTEAYGRFFFRGL